MKWLIVLAALATLLASASGCSMLNRSGAQSCDPTSSAPILSRLRLPSISLPWRRARDLNGEARECSTCNEGFSETGFVEGQVMNGASYDGIPVTEGQVFGSQIVGGPVYDGAVVSESYLGATSSSGPTLYHPEVVGPVSTPPSYSTKYAGELIPAPGSPAVDLGK